jgi:hypothetical protein
MLASPTGVSLLKPFWLNCQAATFQQSQHTFLPWLQAIGRLVGL